MRLEEHCVDLEKIEEVLALPADHPERRHAETCPRCTSLVASYRSFVDAVADADADIDWARSVLDARIRDGARRWSPRPGTPSLRRSMWSVFRRPAFVVALATLVIGVVAVWTLRSPERETFRGNRTESAEVVLHPPVVTTPGAIKLSWDVVPGADRYQVRIYGPDMSEIYRPAAGPETSLTLSRSALPADLPADLSLSWQVDALSNGDVIASSAPGSIRTR
jgi:hypothetical protein